MKKEKKLNQGKTLRLKTRDLKSIKILERVYKDPDSVLELKLATFQISKVI